MSQAKNSLPTALGRLVRFWRGTFKLSQEELALALDSSTRHISRLETGSVHPSREVVLKIADYFNLKRRDTSNLLIAGGYIPQPIDPQVRSQEYRWMRRIMAMNLSALDPYPAMLTDGQTGILMCNKSWLGLFHKQLDLSLDLHISDYFAVIMDAIILGAREERRESAMCGLALSLKQEALMRDEANFEELVNRLVEEHQLPENWPSIAALEDPKMSFPVSFEVDGKHQKFFHLCNGITSLGPVENAMEPLLLMIKLFPDNPDAYLSVLVAHDIDHPSLFTHELNRA